MHKYILTTIGIIVAILTLLMVNEFSEKPFIKDYVMILISFGMFLCLVLTTLDRKSKVKK
jgi:hypothetical protein